MRTDRLCCISPVSPLSPFCCMRRAALFVASLAHITLLLLCACEITCRLIHVVIHEQCCCSLCHTVLSCLSTAGYVDSLIRCMRAAILCYISLEPSVASPLPVPWLNMRSNLHLLRVCKIVHENCRKDAADASRNSQVEY